LNGDRNRAALGEAMPYSTTQSNLILLKLHARTATKTKSASGKSILNIASSDIYTRRHALNNGDQLRPMRFSSG
jgi:hypothetical protein